MPKSAWAIVDKKFGNFLNNKDGTLTIFNKRLEAYAWRWRHKDIFNLVKVVPVLIQFTGNKYD